MAPFVPYDRGAKARRQPRYRAQRNSRTLKLLGGTPQRVLTSQSVSPGRVPPATAAALARRPMLGAPATQPIVLAPRDHLAASATPEAHGRNVCCRGCLRSIMSTDRLTHLHARQLLPARSGPRSQKAAMKPIRFDQVETTKRNHTVDGTTDPRVVGVGKGEGAR